MEEAEFWETEYKRMYRWFVWNNPQALAKYIGDSGLDNQEGEE